MFGAAAAPLVETWCDKESPLGTVSDAMGRKVYRFTAEDDLSSSATILRALQTTRGNPGFHLHGSLPCTPWASRQRLNLHRGSLATKARIACIREQSLEWVKTYTRLGKTTLAGGGSVSFEWPRFCDGQRQEGVRSVISELKLIPVSVDGCAAGVVDEGHADLQTLARDGQRRPPGCSHRWLQVQLRSLAPQVRGGLEGRADGVLPSAPLRGHPQGL